MNANEMEAALRDSSDFLKAQLAFGFTDREAEVRSLCAQISELRSLDKAGAARLSRALADMDWENAEQVLLATAVRERSQKESPSGKKGARPRQTCQNFELYLKESQWATLDDPTVPMAAKINLMKQACADLKMFLPSEPTKGRIAEILRQCGMTAEMKNKCHGSVYKEFLNRVKGELASLQKITSTAPHIASFPVSPPDLEKETPDVYKKVYATEPPHQRELAGLQIARGVRKSHKDFTSAALVEPSAERSADTTSAMQHMFGFDPTAASSNGGHVSQLVGATAPRVPPAMMQQIQHHMVPIVSQLIDNKLQTNQMQAPPAPHASHAFSQRGVAMSLQGTSPFACVSQRAPSPSAKSEAETEPRCRESPPRLYGELSSAGGQVKRENVSPADARMSREEASSAVAPPTGNLHDSDVDSLDSDEKRMQDGLTERSKRLKQIKQRKRREEDEEEDEDEKDERKGADGVSGGAPGAKVAKKRPAAAKGGVIKRPAASMRDASSADHAKPATLPKPLMGPQGTDPVFYRGGKISVSTTKGGYRVFPRLTSSNPSDRLIAWTRDNQEGRAAAWKKALQYIDDIRS